MDLDQLQVGAGGAQLLGEAAAHVGVHGLDQRRFAHAAGAPQQRVVGRQAAGKALGVLGELRRDVLDALQQLQRHAVDLRHRLEALGLGVPDESVGALEIGFRGRRRRQPLECRGEAFQALHQGGFVVHHHVS